MRTLWVLNAVDTRKNEIREEMRGSRDWDWVVGVRCYFTCEVMFLRHVIPRKERYFDVVHVDESVAEKKKRWSHDRMRNSEKECSWQRTVSA